jgi:hypothetical protein
MSLRLVKQGETHDASAAWVEAFHEVFWPAYYPLRRGLPNPKGAALAMWLRVKDRSEANFQRVMQEFRACEAAWRDTEPCYIPHARKWLHDRIHAGVFYPSEGVASGKLP